MPPDQTSHTDKSVVKLPAPVRTGGMSLAEALNRRRSVREFAKKPLDTTQLGQLCWAAQGITHGEGMRTAPSAGAFYPLELYVATADGFFHYEPAGHQLHKLVGRDLRGKLFGAALFQDQVREAPAVFVIAAVHERTSQKYGEARAIRYINIEVGHAAQNLLLETVALGLAAVPVGAFQDMQVENVLELPPEQHPLYLVPVGYAR